MYIWHLLNVQPYIFGFADVGDLQSFVNVSLTTSAEEGALANDRLSTLSTVGTGYRSLIYDLKPNAGFATLSKACNTIWEALKMNPDLPKQLVKICSFVVLNNCLQCPANKIRCMLMVS